METDLRQLRDSVASGRSPTPDPDDRRKRPRPVELGAFAKGCKKIRHIDNRVKPPADNRENVQQAEELAKGAESREDGSTAAEVVPPVPAADFSLSNAIKRGSEHKASRRKENKHKKKARKHRKSHRRRSSSSDSCSSSSRSCGSSESVFRDANEDRGGRISQGRLIRWASAHPGRLAAKSLQLMESRVGNDMEPERRPSRTHCVPAAKAYYLRVLKPESERINAGVRNLREMKTLAYAIDHLARGRVGEASDILVMRLKAVEMAAKDNSWDRANFLELVPEEKVTNYCFFPLPCSQTLFKKQVLAHVLVRFPARLGECKH